MKFGSLNTTVDIIRSYKLRKGNQDNTPKKLSRFTGKLFFSDYRSFVFSWNVIPWNRLCIFAACFRFPLSDTK